MNINLNDSPNQLSKRTIPVFLLLFFFLIPPIPAFSFELLVGADTKGSFSHYTARALCRMLARQDNDLTCTQLTSTNGVDTLTNIQNGSLDLALVDSQLLNEALKKNGPFEFLDISYDQVRIIAPLFDMTITFVVRDDADIASCDQLPGKRINTGAPGSPQKRLVKKFMSARGWSEDDFTSVAELSSSLSQDRIAFANGTIQAMVHQGVHPDPSLERLMAHSRAHLIGLCGKEVEAMVAQNPGMSIQHPSSTAKQSSAEPIETFGTTVTLVTSADLDDETVRLVVDTLRKNKAQLRAMHPALSTFDIGSETMWFGGIKVHGAVAE